MWFGLIWFPWTLSSWVRGPLKMGPSRPKTGSYRPSSPIHFQVLFLLLVSGRVIFMTFLGWHFSDQDSQLLIDLNIYLPRKNTTTVATFIWPSTWKPDNQQSSIGSRSYVFQAVVNLQKNTPRTRSEMSCSTHEEPTVKGLEVELAVTPQASRHRFHHARRRGRESFPTWAIILCLWESITSHYLKKDLQIYR